MTRSRKSRKPGVGSSGAPKVERATISTPSDKKPKKKNGKVAGNRQMEAEKKSNAQRQNTQSKDPRLGSKKPIVLTKTATPAAAKPAKKAQKQQPIASVRAVDPSVSLRERLEEIEQDEQLLAIIAKQDDEQALSEDEIQYFNQLMDEHSSLQEKLGIDDEEMEAEAEQPLSEDDLWNKLDGSDFSNFDYSDDK